MVERLNLGKFGFRKISEEQLEQYTIAERVRMSFEELGPTFVKLGQLMASRPDLVPAEFVTEFKKLHDRVQPVAASQIKSVIEKELGANWQDIYKEFDERPLAAASIAQVHRGVLLNGQAVVVKVCRPKIVETIKEDLSVLMQLVGLLEKYVPESQIYNPKGIVDEFCRTLELETNFIVEANNIRKFTENFKDHTNIKIPQVFLEYSTSRVLVMEFMEGVPLSQSSALTQPGVDPNEIIRVGLRCYLKMVFRDGFFHGDLHPGNFFVLPHNQVGLIDFGVVGRLNRKTQSSIANMLVALSMEDYDRLAFEYVELAPFSEKVDVDRFARELRDLIAPYYGLTLKDFNPGRVLMDSAAVAGKHHLIVPSELILFFRSIIAIEGMGRLIKEDFDFLNYAIEFASELIKDRYDPARLTKDFYMFFRESSSLFYTLPRQIRFLLRKASSPGHSSKHELKHFLEFKRSFETGFHLLFLAIVIGSLILSASIIFTQGTGPQWFDMPVMALIGYGLAALTGVIAFFNYIRK